MDVVRQSPDRPSFCSLFEIAGKVVYNQLTTYENYVDLRYVPDSLAYYLMRQPLEPVSHLRPCEAWKRIFADIDVLVWIRLLKYEEYRPTLFHIYQQLKQNANCSANNLISGYERMCQKSEDVEQISKIVNYGLKFGTFLSEGSWYSDGERVLTSARDLAKKLPDGLSKITILLECCHRLFNTSVMFFKFHKAAELFEEICRLTQSLDRHGVEKNYSLLYTEFARYCFLKNNYDEAYFWIEKAIKNLNNKIAVSAQIQVLRQASRICVVKHDFAKAKYLIHQALARAEQYYGSNHYKLGGLLIDFGYYLLNSDNIVQSVSVYRDAFRLRTHTFGSRVDNLHVAMAEEDLAYALYVLEYTSGYFEQAMEHAENAVKVMKQLLPANNLMLCSANRVKALILEEQALDNFQSLKDEEVDKMLKEAERLHKDALSLTKETFGENNILTAKHYGNLGRLYQSMKKYEEAEDMHLKAIKLKERMLGADDYEVGLSIGHLASLYNYQTKDFGKAEELYFRSISINLKLFSESFSGLEYDYRGLIHVYENLGDEEQYLEFSEKLTKWKKLRKIRNRDPIDPDFYKTFDVVAVEEVINSFEAHVPSISPVPSTSPVPSPSSSSCCTACVYMIEDE